MWKYQCKRHLLFLFGAAIFGAVIFGLLGYSEDALQQAAEMANFEEILEIPYLEYIVGAIFGAGAANGMLLLTYIVQRYHMSFWFVYLIVFFLFSPMTAIGTLVLIPTIFVCIYGWLTIPNRSEHKNLKKNKVNSVAEVERVYRLHHKYLSEYEDLAKKVWDYTMRITLSYIIGLLVVFLLILWIDNMLVLMLSVFAYGMLYLIMARKKAMAMQPIISLLYDECNPEACASVIFALAKKARKRKSFPLPQYLAQCMIFLNDPHLAADIMVTCERNRGAIQFPYYTVMGYAYYQLGDRGMVKFQLDECEKAGAGTNNQAVALLREQCLTGIKNKLDLMDKKFDSCKQYFRAILEATPFECQRVDAHYYLGLIAFVDRDLDDAKYHFNYVEGHGNTMYFKEKAKSFLATIAKHEETVEEV